MEFNYEAEAVSGLTIQDLLRWITGLHSQLTDVGGYESLDTETHQQLMILAKAGNHD